MSESRFYHITDAGKLSRVASLEAALAGAKEDGFVWIDYTDPTKEDLMPLVGTLGLHPLSIEDCLDESQIPKIEDFPGNTFILVNAFSYTKQQLTVSEIDLFIGDNFLVSVSRSDQAALWYGMERIVQLDVEGVRNGPAFLMHVLLDHVVDHKFVALEALEDELDAAEEAVLASTTRFEPAELIHLRRNLLDLRKSLFHEREILVKICRKDCPYISEKAIFHYRDIYDHLAKSFELTESYRDIVTSLMEMYLSMLNNQMTKAANDTNVTVRRLTFITTIFMPLSLLAGIGGMSEWSMMTGPQNWRIAYPVFLLVMAAIGFLNYYLLKWLEKRKS